VSAGRRAVALVVRRLWLVGLVALGCATLAGAAGAQSGAGGVSVQVLPGADPREDESFTYTVRVTNGGPRGVSGATLVFAFPPAKFQPTSTLPAGTVCVALPSPPSLSCALGPLAAGQSAELVFVGRLLHDGTAVVSASVRRGSISLTGVTAAWVEIEGEDQGDDGDGGDSDRRRGGRRDRGGPTCDDPGSDAIVGTENSETIQGTPGDDVILGLGGEDRLVGLAGDDLLCGGDGNDQLIGDQDGGDGQAGNDILEGEADTDFLIGDNNDSGAGADGANDKLDGGDSPDFVVGDNNTTTSGGGVGEAGDDDLQGGEGDDTVFGDNSNSGGGGGPLAGSGGDDAIDGGAGDDILAGQAGDDVLDADDDESDLVDGGDDNDECNTDPPPVDTVLNCESGTQSRVGRGVIGGSGGDTGESDDGEAGKGDEGEGDGNDGAGEGGGGAGDGDGDFSAANAPAAGAAAPLHALGGA
jgi:hypothetical protein